MSADPAVTVFERIAAYLGAAPGLIGAVVDHLPRIAQVSGLPSYLTSYPLRADSKHLSSY